LAKQQERLALSQNERDRLKVVHEAEQGHLTQKQGAEQLGMSERGFRKMLRRLREKGDAAVVHGLRNRRSNRRLGDETAAQALVAVKRDYSDFGPTLAAEYLKKDLSITVSRETLRQLLIREGCGKPNPERSGRRMCGGRGAAAEAN
jgi:hypothetical protein